MKEHLDYYKFLVNLFHLSQKYSYFHKIRTKIFFLVCNDLWNYNPDSHIWTCISGSNETNQPGIYNNRDVPSINNIPGSCYQTISWNITTTNLFEFGGNGIDTKKQSGDLDDLWKFNLLNLEWIWISGYNLSRKSGTYRQKRSFFQI